MIWTSVYGFAQALKDALKVRSVRRAFDLQDEGDDFSSRLSQLTAMYSPVRQHPLLMGLQLAQLPDTRAFIQGQDDTIWLRDAVEVAGIFVGSVEFMRSRLPGYPSLRVPHLRPGSPHVFMDPLLVAGFPWDPALRTSGLQLASAPSLRSLGSDADFAALLTEAVGGLKTSHAWERFAHAEVAMRSPDWDQLRDIGRTFAARVTPDAMTEAVGELVLPRFQYRTAVLADLVEESAGPAREYLEAFEAVNELINFAVALIETMVVSPGLPSAKPVQMALGEGIELRPIHFVALGDDPFMSPGSVIHVDGPLPTVTGFVYAHGITHSWKRLDDSDSSKLIVHGRFATA